MFKLYTSELGKRRQELMVEIMGYQALGWEGEHFSQEPGGDIPGQQPVAVLAEARLVPGHIIDAEPDQPAEQHVEL